MLVAIREKGETGFLRNDTNIPMNHKKIILNILSIVIPLGIMLFICKVLGVTPFGDKSLAVWDGNAQYMDYLAYYKSILTGRSDWLYSFSKTIGDDMIGLLAYYLLSPFHIVVLFFSKSDLPLAFGIIYMLKVSCCSLAFQIFQNRKGEISGVSLLFSVSYALMAYNAGYGFNIMWLDAVMVLPFLVWGLERIIKENRGGLYTVSLAYALITNYYIGFMLSVFSVVYYFLSFVCYEKEKRRSLKRYILSSLTAGGLAAFVLLPVFLSLQGGKSSFSTENFILSFRFDILKFAGQLFSGYFNVFDLMNDSLPKVFCGFLPLIFCCVFFISAKAPKRDKLFYGGLLTVLFLSFWIRPLDLIWHGLNEPEGCPYRYSFLFSFVLILIGSKGISLLPGLKTYPIILSISLALVCVGCACRFTDLTIRSVGLTVFLYLSAYMLWICLAKKRRFVCLGIALLMGVQFFDISYNLKVSWESLLNNTELSVTQYRLYVDSVQETMQNLPPENGFYRMEIGSGRRNYNDAMLFQYNGLSHYSSTEKIFLQKWEEFIGMSVWKEAATPTLTADCLLGLKYILSSTELTKPYERIFSGDSFQIYRNDDALPLLMLSENNLMDLRPFSSKDPFIEINQIFQALSGLKDQDIFLPVPHESKINDYVMDFTLTITENLPVYICFPPEKEAQASAALYVQGEIDSFYYTGHNYTIVPLGTYEKGETVYLSLISDDGPLPSPNACFYYENQENLHAHCEAIKARPVSFRMLSASHIVANVTETEDNDERLLFFTIPYDDGWRISLDGRAVKPLRALDTFLAVSIDGGAHEISLRFIPVGLMEGIAVTCMTLALSLWTLRKRKRTG